MKKPKPIVLTLNHEAQKIIHTYSPLVQSKLKDTCSIIFNKLNSACTPEQVETQTTKLLSKITEKLTASVAALGTVKMPNLPSNKKKNLVGFHSY